VTLSNKQLAFVEHYLQCWNATEAARLAGYSEKTAYSQGPRLLKNVEVASRVRARIDELKMSADELMVRLSDQARGTMADFVEVTEDGEWKPDLNKAVEQNKLHLIKKLKKTVRTFGPISETTIEFELYDAESAKVHLAKMMGIYKTTVEIDWKRELQDAGLNPDELEQDLVKQFERHLLSGQAGTPGVSAGESESAS
jgi:phage terminase small subunit